jgi:serine/threonine-protein kinase
MLEDLEQADYGVDSNSASPVTTAVSKRYPVASPDSAPAVREAPPISTAPATLRKSRPVLFRVAGILLAVILGVVLLWSLLPQGWYSSRNRGGLGGLPSQKHLVVLPFANVGENPSNKALCDGLVEILTSKLTQLEQPRSSLWVVPASEVRARSITSVEDARKAFGVTLAATGSMQHVGSNVRLTLNLVDASTVRQLRSWVFDEPATNLTGLQDGTVVKLAEMLEIELHPETLRVMAAGSTTIPGALEFYLQGRGYLNHYEKQENLETAINLFDKALKEDPNYALAYAGKGEAVWRKYEATRDTKWVEPAIANCKQAIKLNDHLPAAHITLGLVDNGTGRYEEAISAFQRALELEPGNPDAYRGLGKSYEAKGQLDKAESTYKKAIELRPDYWAGYNTLGVFYYLHGRYADALTQWQQVVSLTPDSFWGYNNLGGAYLGLERSADARQMFERSLKIEPNYGAYSNLGSIYFSEGRYGEAASMFEKALEKDPRDYKVWGNLASTYYWMPEKKQQASSIFRRAAGMAETQRKINPRSSALLSNLALYYAMMGDRNKALDLVRQALDSAPQDVNVMYRAAQTYEQLGQRDPALEWIGKALANGYPRTAIDRSPGLRELRKDSRFQSLQNRSESEMKKHSQK